METKVHEILLVVGSKTDGKLRSLRLALNISKPSCSSPNLALTKTSLSHTRKGGDEMNFWAIRSPTPDQ